MSTPTSDDPARRAEVVPAPTGNPRLTRFAWLVILLFSDLPEILMRALGGSAPPDLTWPRGIFLAVVAALCFGLRPLRPLAPFAGVMLVVFLGLRGAAVLGQMPLWRRLFAGTEASFGLSYLDVHLRDLGVALAVLVALRLLVGERRRFFFARGDLGAPLAPIRWLGIRAGSRWRPFVWIFGGAAALAVAGVVLASIRLEPGDGAKLLRHLPAVLLLAAVNAFAEEVYFRLSLFGTLLDLVGKGQAMAMNVVLFGLAHWLTGSPPGLPGALMTGFLAYLMGRAILETRGLLGAWIIHILPDIVIFATYALFWRQG